MKLVRMLTKTIDLIDKIANFLLLTECKGKIKKNKFFDFH